MAIVSMTQKHNMGSTVVHYFKHRCACSSPMNTCIQVIGINEGYNRNTGMTFGHIPLASIYH